MITASQNVYPRVNRQQGANRQAKTLYNRKVKRKGLTNRSLAMSEQGDWLTTKEAAEMLGLSVSSMVRRASAGWYTAKKVHRDDGCGMMWLILREPIEAEVAEKGRVARLIAQGRRRCSGCKEWLKRSHFWKGQKYCKACLNDYRLNPRHKRTWAGMGGDPVSGEPVSELVGGRAQPRDALQYACMDIGWRFRPLPIDMTGKSTPRRKAFCPTCDASHCYHYPDLTPAEVRRKGIIPSRYPEKRVIGVS